MSAVDPISWRKGRVFAGAERTTEALADHLAARRERRVDPEEPTGLLTHHLVHDTETWEFLGALLDWCAKKPNIQWRNAADLFPDLGTE